MTTIYAMHPVDRDSDHYRAVRQEMRRLGAPTVRAVWSEGHGVWLALEGSHRLAAAAEVGLVPVVVDVTGATSVAHDLQDYASPADLTDGAADGVAMLLLDVDRLNATARYRYDDEDMARGRVGIESTLRVPAEE